MTHIQDALAGMPEPPPPPPPPPPPFTLGQRVRWDERHVLHRRVEEAPREPGQTWGPWRKVWKAYVMGGPVFSHTHRGIVVGVRTYSDGRVIYGSEDEPTTFKADTHYRVVLVTDSVARKPVAVLPDNIVDGWG